MDLSIFSSRAQTLNAKVGAVTLTLGAFMTLALTHTATSLAPLRILTLAIACFAAWAFADEMGVHKPLNRAGLVCFFIAAGTKIQLALGVDEHLMGRYLLLYAAFLMLAILFWSVAFLHRQRRLKAVGAVGVLAALAPIVAIVVGHLVVGIGAAIGVGSLLAATQGGTISDTGFVTLVERIFGVWAYVSAWMLWRGHIEDEVDQEGQGA